MSPAGVSYLDHTADVGMDVRGSSRPELFHRAAHGMMALLRGDEELATPAPAAALEAAAASGETHALELHAADLARLLGEWLRELLFLHDARRLDYHDAQFDRLDDRGLRARIRLVAGGAAVREIKGVTYHELDARRDDEGWQARVIFDV